MPADIDNFRASLASFQRGELSFEALRERLNQHLARSQGNTRPLLQALDQAREGFQHHVYVALRGLIESAPPPGGDETVIRSDGETPDWALSTRIAPSPAALAARRREHRPSPSASVEPQAPGEDATRIHDPGHRPHGQVPPARGDDATALDGAGGTAREGTVLGVPGVEPTTSEPPHARDDRTVMDGGDATIALADDATLATSDAPTLLAGDEHTVAEGLSPIDATLALGAGQEATEAAGQGSAPTGPGAAVETTRPPETTVTEAPDSEPIDLLDPAALEAAAEQQASPSTGQSWPTDTSWRGAEGGGTPRAIGPGTVLKERFELVQALGEGGMGVVYKAVDRLKVEARDRHPYLAIKLLTGDFQTHPEAFIALQRESAKAQRLAHPNIATVYDFDRDRGTIYMTMELLEGDALNHFIRRKLPSGGLPAEEAMRLIKQLGAGLSYAHQHQLVHSDLKPGNCWLGSDGTVKLLDFGIARASKTKADESGETTVFDPGQLGALTPAYATVEMFEGLDPDPRDDIYALACIAYELLTGRHPYDKVAAPKALEKGLTPAPVSKLDKRQNRALAHALALKREDRTPTVDQFLEEIRPRKSHTGQIVAGSVAALLLLAAVAYQPVRTYFEDRRNAAIAQRILSGDAETVRNTLAGLDTLDRRSRGNVLGEVKDHLIDLYQHRAETAVELGRGRYDFPGARRELEAARRYYPDSARIVKIENALESRKKRLLNDLTERYNRHLEAGRLIPLPDQEDITDVLRIVAQVAPGHRLLKDPRLAVRYAEEAQKAIEQKNYRRADGILEASLAYAPDDSGLASLRYQVEQELRRQREETKVREIAARLEVQQPRLKALPDFLAVREDLIQLAELRPDSPILSALQERLERAFSAELKRAIDDQAWDRGEQRVGELARLLSIPYLLAARGRLSAAEQKAGYRPEPSAGQRARIETHQGTLDALLKRPMFDEGWHNRLLLSYKDLVAALPPGTPWLARATDQIARVYLGKVQELAQANRYAEARSYLQEGRRLAPSHPDFARQEQSLARAEQRFKEAQAEKARLARLEGLKQTLLTQTEADKVQEAKKTLAELRRGLAPGDPFLTREAPTAIAEAYARLAAEQASQKRYAAALKLADAGLALAPSLQSLSRAREGYVTEERIARLARIAGGRGTIDLPALRREIAVIKKALPKRYAALEPKLADGLRRRIQRLEAKDAKAAERLLSTAKELLPGNRTLASIRIKLPPKPSRLAARGQSAVQEGKLTLAQSILEEAQRKEPGHPEVAAFKSALQERRQRAEATFAQAERAFKFRQKTKGRAQLEQAIALWSDNEAYRKRQRDLAGATPPARTASGARPCRSGLAGFGRRSRGTCYDVIGEKKKGPVMVVVPSGGGIAKPFAIGKYEVSVGDFNTYCRASGKCRPLATEADLPVTGITVAQARAYADWLSKTTGHRYRLPTDREWVYAATATGVSKTKNFNCRVQRGDQILKGHALLNSRSGRQSQNGWGLANFVGNAQEWVTRGQGIAARGGAYLDSLSECDIQLSRNHSGRADDKTGFRLVRDLG